MSIGRRRCRGAGFTLVELLVVIAIIGVLIAVLLPSLAGARASARTLACLSNQRQIGVAFLAYAVDHQGSFPTHTNWANCMGKLGTDMRYDGPEASGFADEPGVVVARPLNKYLQTPDVCRCPSDRGDPYWYGLVANCFEAYGTSYYVPFQLDLFGIAHVTSHPRGTAPLRIPFHGPASTKIIMGDFFWPPNRLLESQMGHWHNSSSGVRQRRPNILFADGHVETFTFPEAFENGADPESPAARVAPDPNRGYW